MARAYRPPQIPDDAEFAEILELYTGDLRRMFIEQPRVRMDGVYIAVCHYMYVPSDAIYMLHPLKTSFADELAWARMFGLMYVFLSSVVFSK